MVHVRGIVVLNTVLFVKREFGEEAHLGVLARLTPVSRNTLLQGVREASWHPLEQVVAYMEAARALLAPDDPAFFRRMGTFSGRIERTTGGFLPMVADPATAMRLAPVMWRSFYDTGRLEVIPQTPTSALARVHDLPAMHPHCERLCGSWEGLLSNEASVAVVGHTACLLKSAPFCEWTLAWT